MANVTTQYLIDVGVDLDATGVSTGAEQAETAIEELASAVAASGESMESAMTEVGTTATTQLGTTVPAAADQSAVGLTTKASKFKAVGTELGTNLAQGVGSGVSAPEAIAGTTQSLSGLLAATASSGKGALAAVGLGLGAALITNMIRGLDAERQRIAEQFDSLFAEIEVKAENTGRDIRDSILEAFTFEEAIKALGGSGGVSAGLEKVNALVAATGADFNEVVDILRGDLNPENRDTLRLLQEQAGVSETITGARGETTEYVSQEARFAKEVLENSERQRDINGDLLDAKRKEADYLRHIADDSGRAADNTKRAADEASRLASNLNSAERAAARLNARTANGLENDVA